MASEVCEVTFHSQFGNRKFVFSLFIQSTAPVQETVLLIFRGDVHLTTNPIYRLPHRHGQSFVSGNFRSFKLATNISCHNDIIICAKKDYLVFNQGIKKITHGELKPERSNIKNLILYLYLI